MTLKLELEGKDKQTDSIKKDLNNIKTIGKENIRIGKNIGRFMVLLGVLIFVVGIYLITKTDLLSALKIFTEDYPYVWDASNICALIFSVLFITGGTLLCTGKSKRISLVDFIKKMRLRKYFRSNPEIYDLLEKDLDAIRNELNKKLKTLNDEIDTIKGKIQDKEYELKQLQKLEG